MSAGDVTAIPSQAAREEQRPDSLRLIFTIISVGVPVLLWFAPLDIPVLAKEAMAISSFMILAWMTNIMEYGAAGLIGCLLFWFLGVAKIETAFSGFVNDIPWFLFGAILLGAAGVKTGVPQRIGAFVVTRIGSSYSNLLLGLVIASFVLTLFVPSGAARLVVMAAIAIGVINVFGVEKGSNIGRGIFLVITYTAAIFDKMVIAGAGAITAVGNIQRFGGVQVSWAMWFFAFLPCALLTILSAWLFAKWVYPPEIDRLDGARMEALKERLRTSTAWDSMAKKATALSLLAIAFWLTDFIHHVSPSIIALAMALIAFLPYVDVLNADDMRKVNLMPVFFVAAALSMSNVAQQTGALKLITDNFFGFLQPLLANKIVAVPALYWGGFVYHFATASEISMLATSLPVLMEFAKSHGLDVLWIGMVWGFSAGGKLFAYQSAPLVIGYSYGYFKHTDLIKIGAILTVIEFFGLALSAAIYWPLLGI
ncbi:MAG TPA: SLC13 family permease [Micropepsaceae bacterium]|nr:SLC13 family permease [Micropepsaceae bacterium]